MQMIKNPVKTCDIVYSLIQNLTLQIRQRMEDPKSAGTKPEHQGKRKISVLIHLELELLLSLSFSLRHPAVPQRDSGADATSLVQTGEGLQDEKRTLQHQ